MTTYLNRRGLLSILLLPISLLYCMLVVLRRQLFRLGVLRSRRVPVPVVVIGNITVGGTGKTPLVAALAKQLAAAGWKPGIVSRGYGGRAPTYPFAVDAAADPAAVGDEPLLLAMKTGLPVAIDPKRPYAAAWLAKAGCDIVLSDDGLQHYALRRDVELAVVDGQRRFGNGWCLPAGPLREPPSRLREVDMVICNGEALAGEERMTLRPVEFINVFDMGRRLPLAGFKGRPVHATAGIGNPERFFVTLEKLGIKVQRHPRPDHYSFRAADLRYADELPVLMTEKDAVKCRHLHDLPEAVQQRCWALAIEAELDQECVDRLLALIKENVK